MKPPLDFVQRRLPWFIAGGALLVYCLTLPRWITFLGLAPLARATGWDWHPVLHAPLQFLVTYPFRWLPPGGQVVGLNLLAAICATLALALLARSVAILPQDRTRDQRQAERGDHSFLSIPTAWLPPLLAVLVCGLQLTFWEHAAVWTGEALDLLLFAYVVRCLLEFRIDPRDSWLLRMAAVYGMAMANNFAMIAFLPAFAIALVWIKGLPVFNFRFCMRMALCGLAGLSLYLVPPLLHVSSGLLDLNVWEVLRLNLGFQKNAIFSFRRVVLLLLSFTSILPVLFMGIKWPATFGDISAAGNALTNLMTHVIHGVFLLACLYVAFDPGYSPRSLGSPYPFLSFYYLGALSIGYLSGYFLLIFGTGQLRAWQRPSLLRMALNRGIAVLVWVAAVAVPAGLVYKNAPLLKGTLGPALSQYGTLAAKSLPPEGAVVLNDAPPGQYPIQLYATYAALQKLGTLQNYVLVENGSMWMPYYHRFLNHRYPKRWPQPSAKAKLNEPVSSAAQVRLLQQLGQAGPICYLQPSFGYYLERFYLRPRSLVYELKPYPTNTLTGPALSAAEINANVQFWEKMKNEDLKSLLDSLKPAKGKKPASFNAIIGTYYSRAVDYLGVEMQRAGNLEKAGEFFGLALALNPESGSALVNRDYNQNLRAGHREALKRSEAVEKALSGFAGNWDSLLAWNGPVDEPVLLNDLAQIFATGGNPRQAAQLLSRVVFLTPTNTDARVGLAEMCLRAGLIDLALNSVAEARASVPRLHTADREGLIKTEGWAHVYRNDLPTAERILQEAQAKNPLDIAPYTTLAEIYLQMRRITNAIEVLEKELKAQPENSGALNNLARLRILNNELEPAIKLLDHALSLDPKNTVILFNRAISNLRIDRLDDAQRDYQTLETSLPKIPHTVYYGLFDIACKKKNPKTALHYGELYLAVAPKGGDEYNQMMERIKKVKSGSF